MRPCRPQAVSITVMSSVAKARLVLSLCKRWGASYYNLYKFHKRIDLLIKDAFLILVATTAGVDGKRNSTMWRVEGYLDTRSISGTLSRIHGICTCCCRDNSDVSIECRPIGQAKKPPATHPARPDPLRLSTVCWPIRSRYYPLQAIPPFE